MSEKHDRNLAFAISFIYYVLLSLIAVGILYPGKFWFAFNFGAYLPSISNWILIAFAVVIPPIYLLMSRRSTESDQSNDLSVRYEKLITIIFIIVGITLFYLLRAKAFYLGDGDSLLASVASSNPIIKMRSIGESISHVWLSKLLGGPNERSALLSYQLISIGSGLFFLLIAFVLSRKLFSSFVERVLFVVLWISGGYSLLFFGYVENYSMLSVSVVIFSAIGLLIARNQLSRFWILPAFLFAITMHGLALALTPAMLFVLFCGTIVDRVVRSWSRVTKIMIVLLISVSGLAAFQYLSSTNFFFRFAFVPIIENRFTVEHYTLFSVRHLADFGNLLIILFPAGLLALVYSLVSHRKVLIESTEKSFLLILSFSTLTVPFLMDPKLGMPRDWDLFAFAGVPLGLFVSLYLVRSVSRRSIMYVIVTAICLNLLFLSQRVLINQNEEAAFEQFYDYYYFAPLLNQNSFFKIADHYQDKGDYDRVIYEHNRWNTINPSWGSNAEGKKLMDAGQIPDAIMLYRKAIELNPAHSAAYSNMASAYMMLGMYDSAQVYFTIARGMNPYNPRVNLGYGILQLRLGEYQEAEKSLLKTIKIDPKLQDAYMGLMSVYRKTDRRDDYYTALEAAVNLGSAPANSYRQLIQYYLLSNEIKKAHPYVKKLAEFPEQTAYIDTLYQIFPQLR